MAPEQLEAGEVDRRADIWALGCVLYEMLTQKTPFAAEYEQAIAFGILNEQPEAVSSQRADVKPEIDRLIGKAMEKDAADGTVKLTAREQHGTGRRLLILGSTTGCFWHGSAVIRLT